LKCVREEVLLEVKSAVMKVGEYAMYPDYPSPRGRRHLEDIKVEKGGRGGIVFITTLPGVTFFTPNRFADPEMYRLLVKAERAGVNIKAVSMHYDPSPSFIYLDDPELDVVFNRRGGL